MGKFMKIPVTLTLLVVVICHSLASIQSGSPHHHKVRHKHQFSDQRVNDIRVAFDDYKNVVQKPRVNYEDVVKLKPLRHHRRDKKLEEELNQTAITDPFGETSIANPQDPMVRYKRVHTTETTTTRKSTTTKFSDNYDEEYNDDEDDKSNQRVNDETTKVQVSCVISRLIRI